MLRKFMAVGSLAIVVVLSPRAFAAQGFKNHGQCVRTCVQDLGVKKNDVCSKMCAAGTYGQAPTGGTLPAGAPCEATNDLCAAPLTCQPFMPGFPVFFCK
jgi:hypothetical protein